MLLNHVEQLNRQHQAADVDHKKRPIMMFDLLVERICQSDRTKVRGKLEIDFRKITLELIEAIEYRPRRSELKLARFFYVRLLIVADMRKIHALIPKLFPDCAAGLAAVGDDELDGNEQPALFEHSADHIVGKIHVGDQDVAGSNLVDVFDDGDRLLDLDLALGFFPTVGNIFIDVRRLEQFVINIIEFKRSAALYQHLLRLHSGDGETFDFDPTLEHIEYPIGSDATSSDQCVEDIPRPKSFLGARL